MLDLARGDQNAAGRDEAADHRMREEVGKKAQPKKAQHSQHDTRHSGQRDRRFEIRSEEHTSELQSLMRISYAVLCLKKKTNNTTENPRQTQNDRSNHHITQLSKKIRQ